MIEINADYTRHSLAAREIARQFFDADKVLRSLPEQAGMESRPKEPNQMVSGKLA